MLTLDVNTHEEFSKFHVNVPMKYICAHIPKIVRVLKLSGLT